MKTPIPDEPPAPAAPAKTPPGPWRKWAARLLPPGLVVGLLLAMAGGAAAFYQSAILTGDDLDELEVTVAEHVEAGHRATAEDIAGLRVDVGVLVEKIGQRESSATEARRETNLRLRDIERALRRRSPVARLPGD